MKKRMTLLTFFLLILLQVGCDQASKYLARTYLPRGKEVPVIGSFFVLRYTENRGAFLSLGAALPETLHLFALKVFPVAAILFLIWLVMFRSWRSRLQVTAFSCIIGGGAGNILDRIFSDGMVTDFLLFRFGPLQTGVLNVADLSITLGCILLFIDVLPHRPRKDSSRLQD